MGKSTAGGALVSLAVPVIDTDILAREETRIGTESMKEIRCAFGPDYFFADGGLNRRLLAMRVFQDTASRECLEAILHPRIESAWRTKVSEWSKQSVAMGAVVIPLLFEKGYQDSFDITVCLACSIKEQERRLFMRGWTRSEIEARNTAQWPVGRKIQAARCVIWTEGSVDVHTQQWKRILSDLS